MTVAVVTDSTAALSAGRAAAAGVTVVPLHVLVAGRGRLAEREITPGEVAAILEKGRERVTTSRVSPGEFVTAYREVTERTGCEAIVSSHLSSLVSGTVEAAELARDELAGQVRVEVVDSGVLGMALGYAVCSGAGLAAGGAGVEEVAAEVRRRAAASQTWFYVDTLEHLRRGGRIGRAQALLGSALMIKPLLTIREGLVHPQEKVRTRAKALSRLVDLTAEAVHEAGEVDLAVHELSAREAADELAGVLLERTGVGAEVVELDPVIGVHSGPGTLGVVVAPR